MVARYTRQTISGPLAMRALWPEVPDGLIPAGYKKKYLALRDLICRYLRWERMSELLAGSGYTHEQLLRALNRCMAFHPDGRVYGWRGIIPQQRVRGYVRHQSLQATSLDNKGGFAGALRMFFDANPAIKQRLDKFLLTARRDGDVPDARVSPQCAHQYFLGLCREVPIPKNQWPECTRNKGYESIRLYALDFHNANYDQIALLQYGQRAQSKAATGRGVSSQVQAELPYDVVEMDEHSEQMIGCIGIPTPKGTRYVPIERLTILAITDRASEAVLAATLICRRGANQDDVLELIERSISRWEPRNLSLQGLEYTEGSGYPSGRIEGLESVGYTQLMIDNALSHLAEAVEDRISARIGCAINYGPVGHFERRPFIERVFNRIEQAGFSRVKSTTGSGPKDPKRQDAEKAAADHRITIDAIADLTELVIADSNGKSGMGNFGESPLGQLRLVVEDADLGFIPSRLPDRLHNEAPLDTVIVRKRIGGNQERGVRPHVYFQSASYTSQSLAERWSLIEEPVVLHVNRKNIIEISAFLEDGSPLGKLKAMWGWGMSPHSLESRKLIVQWVRETNLNLTYHDDPVARWHHALSTTALVKNKQSARPKITREATQLGEEQRVGNQPLSPEASAGKTLGQEIRLASSVVVSSDLPDVKPIKAFN